MKEVQKLESTMAKAFKDLPNISEAGRESLVKFLPIIAVVAGIFQLAAAYWVYKLGRVVEQVNDFVRSYSVLSGTDYGLSGSDKLLIYLGALVLLVDAVILLMAYSGLAKRQKRGWDLLFLGGLLNVAYSVLSLFISGRGFGSFVLGMVGSAFGFWLLFQVRGKYGGKKDAAAVSTPKKK